MRQNKSRSSSQTARATLALREMLLNGRFRPGERIREVPLAAQLLGRQSSFWDADSSRRYLLQSAHQSGYRPVQRRGANSSYHSLQANLNRRFSHNVQGQVSYTWSHCIDTSSNTYGLEGGFPAMNPYNVSLDRGNCLFDRRQSLAVSSLVALPFNGKFKGHQLVEGWQLSGIGTVRTGSPFTVGVGFDQAGLGAAFVNNRPILNAGRTVESIKVGTLNQWFDPTAFSLPPVGELGNVGRNTLVGPGFWDVDFSAMKNTKIKESVNLQFRAEMFNVFNHANWGLPNAQVFVQTPGTGGGTYNPIAGRITTLASPMRQIQFALKLIF